MQHPKPRRPLDWPFTSFKEFSAFVAAARQRAIEAASAPHTVEDNASHQVGPARDSVFLDVKNEDAPFVLEALNLALARMRSQPSLCRPLSLNDVDDADEGRAYGFHHNSEEMFWRVQQHCKKLREKVQTLRHDHGDSPYLNFGYFNSFTGYYPLSQPVQPSTLMLQNAFERAPHRLQALQNSTSEKTNVIALHPMSAIEEEARAKWICESPEQLKKIYDKNKEDFKQAKEYFDRYGDRESSTEHQRHFEKKNGTNWISQDWVPGRVDPEKSSTGKRYLHHWVCSDDGEPQAPLCWMLEPATVQDSDFYFMKAPRAKTYISCTACRDIAKMRDRGLIHAISQ